MVVTPGTRLGPCTIETLIGWRGMGEVYQAHDGRLNRTVAIKRMIAEDHSRFRSDARAIAAISLGDLDVMDWHAHASQRR
jgi:hypothetical protein